MKSETAIVLALGAVFVWKILDNTRSVGTMSDPAPTLDNLKRGIRNGWYTAELTMVDGQQAVRLSGKTTDGRYYEDVYPISSDVASELIKIGVKVAE